MNMNNKNRNITEEDLKKGLGDLAYEVDMLFNLVKTLTTSRIREPLPNMPTIRNAHIESFAIHIRNLIEFMYWKNKKGKARALCANISETKSDVLL